MAVTRRVVVSGQQALPLPGLRAGLTTQARKTPPQPAPAVPAEPGRWVITLRAPQPMTSANTRNTHWRTLSAAKRDLRELMYRQLQAIHAPKGLDRVRIDIELRFPRNARRDPPNYHPYVAKPLVDALSPTREYTRKRNGALVPVTELGWGMIPDDNPRHLHCQECPHLTLGPSGKIPGYPYGQITVTITDVGGSE